MKKFLLKLEKRKIVGLEGTNNFEYCRSATGQILSKRDVEIKTFIDLKLSILIRGELLLKDNGIGMTSTNINLNAVKTCMAKTSN